MDLELARELLEDPAYRHVLLNHLPLTALGLAWVVLGWAVVENRWRSIVFGLVVVAFCSGAAVPVMETGGDAYPFVFDRLDGTGRAWLDRHTELADRWGFVFPMLAVVALATIALGHVRAPLRRIAAAVVLVATLVALGVAVTIAEAGGMIWHEEFRLVDPPRTQSR